MLILNRKVGEQVMLGDNITCSVLGIKGKQVLLGFKAPESLVIHRAEIYQKIKTAQNRPPECTGFYAYNLLKGAIQP